MNNFLGEIEIEISESKYRDYEKGDWVMKWIEMYSSISGSHHKDWLIDQIARILKGAKITLKIAKWENGQTEERFSIDENVTPEYWSWVEEMKAGVDGIETSSYDFGIAP